MCFSFFKLSWWDKDLENVSSNLLVLVRKLFLQSSNHGFLLLPAVFIIIFIRNLWFKYRKIQREGKQWWMIKAKTNKKNNVINMYNGFVIPFVLTGQYLSDLTTDDLLFLLRWISPPSWELLDPSCFLFLPWSGAEETNQHPKRSQLAERGNEGRYDLKISYSSETCNPPSL